MTVPQWLLERYALDEVTTEERSLVEADPDLAAQLPALHASDAEILRTHPADTVARRAVARAAPPRRVGWKLLATGGALATAVAALLVVASPSGDGHRAKGLALELRVYRQTPDGSELLQERALAQAGDRLQLEYAADTPHGWLVSVDGAGAVTLHNDGRLEPGIRRLGNGIALDAAPDYEHFFLVASEEPIARAEIMRQIEAFAASRPGPDQMFDMPQADEVGVLVLKP